MNEFQSWSIGASAFFKLLDSFDTQYKLYKALKSLHELLLVHTFVFCAIQQIALQLITTSNLVMARIEIWGVSLCQGDSVPTHIHPLSEVTVD